MAGRTFEEKLSELLRRSKKSQRTFAEELMAFQELKETEEVTELTVSAVIACLKPGTSNNFNQARQALILEYLRENNLRFPVEETEEAARARAQMAGEYLVMYDLGKRKPPPGHSQAIHGRIFKIAEREEALSTYKALRFDNRESPSRKYSGELEWYPGIRPLSGFFVMKEPSRPAAPSAFLLSWVQFDDIPGEVMMFGNGTGFDGDQYNHVISIRALAIPTHWLTFPEPDCLSPESIGRNAFDMIAAYLRQENQTERCAFITEPRLRDESGLESELSTLCREIRMALREFGAAKAAESNETTSD